MIQSFADRGTKVILAGLATRAARATCPDQLWGVARRKLDYLDSAAGLEDLQRLRGNRLEALRGDRQGQHSIRINRQYRICFVWTLQRPRAVEIVDYH